MELIRVRKILALPDVSERSENLGRNNDLFDYSIAKKEKRNRMEQRSHKSTGYLAGYQASETASKYVSERTNKQTNIP